MKFFNIKLLIWIIIIFNVVIFIGCESKNISSSIPIANAGDNQLIIMEELDNLYGKDNLDSKDHNITVILDGSKSYDEDNDSLIYNWTLVSKPDRSELIFDGSSDKKPSFDVDTIGYYIFDLIVNDGVKSSKPSRVTVFVKSYRVEHIKRRGFGTKEDTSFIYNEYGQIIKEQYENNHDLNYEYTYVYNADINITIHYREGEFNKYTKTYDMDGKILMYTDGTTTIKYIYNEKGNIIEIRGFMDTGSPFGYRTKYTYDSDGNILIIKYSDSWCYYSEHIYTYDTNGNMLTHYYHKGEGESDYDKDTYEHIYTYDSDGNMLTDYYKKGNGYTYEHTYTYDINGNILTNYGEDNRGYTYEHIYTYDIDGNMLTHCYNSNNSINYTYTYTYDTNGNMLTKFYEDDRGKSYEHTYTYDIDGNMLTHYYEDVEAVMETWTYDKYGYLIYHTKDVRNDGIIEYVKEYTLTLVP